MSAFLGPIHYWLYNKIKIQNDIVSDIISFSEGSNSKFNLAADLEDKFGVIDNRPLEELIDTTNIHGWLQECVSVVEYRLAYAITTLLKDDAGIIDNLKELYYKAGIRTSAITKDMGVSEIFKKLEDSLLDGMPCDHANMVVAQADNEIVWKRNVCVHEQYWNAVGGDIQNYYLLREEFIKGILNNTNATFEKIDEITSKISINK